ncbi:MAG: nuclear transport factor 2 family protein, partial [Acidobacteriota bacterium]|nr:nuclear transport factor 2 family protein [Acidobacteriota bacterium]
IARSNPPSTDNTGDERPKGDLESLRGAFDSWIASTNARDVDKLMTLYDSKLDTFYRAQNVSKDFVREDKARSLKRADVIEVAASGVETTMAGDNGTATMRFHKRYAVKIDGRERRGEVLDWLRWRRTDEGWKIVGERDLKVLRRD